ncbi:hypothetical protein ACIBQ1_13665 [Nonomuraea sp. NPDC050153]|uniref:hypothetical protein n=1 Tax=Nonomuraea sp. NPDC050153 TaxID=3364359 RepID=UPI00379A61AC
MADRQPVPRNLWQSRGIMIVQGVLGLLGGIFVMALVNGSDMTGGAGLLITLALVSVAAAVALLACAVLLYRGLPWVRVTTLVIEGFTGVGALVSLVSGLVEGSFQPTGTIPLVLSFLVITNLVRPEVRDWFSGSPA